MDIKELGLLRDLRHPNIVHFIGVSIPVAPSEVPVTIVTELCANGDLFDYLRGVPHPPFLSMLEIMLGIAKGLEYLHTRTPSIIHRDIKSSNVLITAQGVAKINDFGLARVKTSTKSVIRSLVGTVNWQAPELWVRRSHFYSSSRAKACPRRSGTSSSLQREGRRLLGRIGLLGGSSMASTSETVSVRRTERACYLRRRRSEEASSVYCINGKTMVRSPSPSSSTIARLIRYSTLQGIGDRRIGRRDVDDRSSCSTINGSSRPRDSTTHHHRKGETRFRQEEISLIPPDPSLLVRHNHISQLARSKRTTITHNHSISTFLSFIRCRFFLSFLPIGFRFLLVGYDTTPDCLRIAVRIQIDTLHPILRITLRRTDITAFLLCVGAEIQIVSFYTAVH